MKKEKAQTGKKSVGANCVRPHIEGITKNKKGITLIALVITIIVMLILVAVSVTVALNGGLFRTAKEAAEGTATKRNEELTLSEGKVQINGEWYDSINEYVNGAGGNPDGDNPGGSTSTVTFKLYNSNDETWHEFTAPSDAVWGDFLDYVPDEEEDEYLYSFPEFAEGMMLFDIASTCFTCWNEPTFIGVKEDTLIADAPLPHVLFKDSDMMGTICTLEICPYYDPDLLADEG